MKQLETKRLILRDWSLEDKNDLFEYAQNPIVGPSAGWKPHVSIDESIKIIKMFQKNKDVYAIELKDTGKVIGSIGIHKRYPDTSMLDIEQREIGYVLNPRYWGKGYVPEAVERAKSYCFEELDIEILWCGHFQNNNQSKRVIEKGGFEYKFTKEEVLKLLDNKIVHVLYYNCNIGKTT